MKRFYVLLVVCSSVNAQPAWDDKLDHEAIEHRLASEKIVGTMNLKKYLSKRGINAHSSHEVLMVELESGLKGVFKKDEYQHGEVAAYRISKALGLRLVPPTVYRKVKGTQGSLQFLIEAPKVSCMSSMKRLAKRVGSKRVSDMKLFYYVFGQWDNHAGNQIIATYNGKSYLALIDNSVILHKTYEKFGGPAFVAKGKNKEFPSATGTEFPYDKVKVVSGRKSSEVFKRYLRSEQCRKMAENDRIAYVIWNYRLWIKLKDQSMKRFTKTFYQSTLDAYEALSEGDLNYAWKDWASMKPEYAADLVKIALMKRDKVVDYAYSRGTIYS